MNKIKFAFFLAVFISGCDSNSKIESAKSLDVPATLIKSKNEFFSKNDYPKILNACPGLEKYRNDWDFDSLTEKELKIKVKSEPSNTNLIEYRAMGHSCYFTVNQNKLSIPKDPCASLCLAESTELNGKNLVIDLH